MSGPQGGSGMPDGIRPTSPASKVKPSYGIWLTYGAFVVVLATISVLLAEQRSQGEYGDFIAFWSAGRMVASGANPYSPAEWEAFLASMQFEWRQDPIFAYPPVVALSFAPFGLLPAKLAMGLWIFLSGLVVIFSVSYVMSKAGGTRPGYLLPVLAGILLFRPVVVTFFNGQTGASLILALIGTMWLWRRDQWLPGGMVLSTLSFKPTVGLPILGLITIWLLLRRSWRGLLGISLGAGLFVVISTAFEPEWLSLLAWVGDRKLSGALGRTPSIWGLAGLACEGATGCVWALGFALIAGLGGLYVLWLVRWRYSLADPRLALAFVAPAGVLLAPYVWAYDQVILVPSIALIVAAWISGHRMPYLAVAAAVPLFSLASLLLIFLALAIGHDVSSVLVPVLVLVGLVIGLRSGLGSGAGEGVLGASLGSP